jgi:AcrR family transcriptional regulator
MINSSGDAPTPGLRDRKRMETRTRIESAATFLVLRDGIEATTIEAISARADISPRTFFNYFESKDSAILGIQQHEVTDEMLAEHVSAAAADGVIPTVVRLVLTVMGSPAGIASLHRDRLEIMRRHPEVVSSQFARLNERATRLSKTVEEILAAHPDFSTDPDLAARAQVVLALCGSGVRGATGAWATDPDTSNDLSTNDIEQRAIVLITDTIRRLA